MVICDTLEQRNAVENAVITQTRSDGKHVVYQHEDVIPEDLVLASGLQIQE